MRRGNPSRTVACASCRYESGLVCIAMVASRRKQAKRRMQV